MSNIILDPLTRRRMADCFYLVIPVADRCDEEIAAAIANAMKVERAVEAVLNGDCSIWESLEFVEDSGPNMDRYCQELEQNLYESLLETPVLTQ